MSVCRECGSDVTDHCALSAIKHVLARPNAAVVNDGLGCPDRLHVAAERDEAMSDERRRARERAAAAQGDPGAAHALAVEECRANGHLFDGGVLFVRQVEERPGVFRRTTDKVCSRCREVSPFDGTVTYTDMAPW